MSDSKKDAPISSGWYLLGGFAVGAAAGLLLAPKKGSETLEDLGVWGRRGRDNARSMIGRLGSALPARIKTAAVIGAVKNAAGEAFNETRDKAREFSGS